MPQFQGLQQQTKAVALSFVLSLLVGSNNNVAFGQLNDFTCNVQDDFVSDPKCPTLSNGICEDPKYNDADGNDACREQDCVDCNRVTCSAFDGDCFNCLNAKGCHYCPGDGTCDNSPFYSDPRNFKVKSCLYTDFQNDFLSFDEGDTDDQCVSDDAYYKDPSYGGSQWMFEMINVIDVWEQYGLTGNGVTIRINDDGVYTDNLEFKNRFDKEENSCSSYLPNADEVNDNGHGTKVAGIILANADNDLCSVGIANKAKFSSCNFFDNTPYSDLTHKLETFDISQNSIGMPACEEGQNIDLIQDENIIYDEGCPFIYDEESEYKPCDSCEGEFTATGRSLSTSCSNAISQHCKYYYREDHDACLDFPALVIKAACDYDQLPQIAITALEKGVTEGRDGKGTIFTFASGNSFDQGDDVNFSGWTNTRYTISVGSVGKNGKHADYSTAGAALLVTAPAGNEKDFGHLMTAGLGVETCADSGPGTSFACPVVSGVLALVLEANPDLTWRDVQGILAATSKNVYNDDEDDTITVNPKNYWHSNWYGFGIIDAKAAVEAALDWELYSEELQAIGISNEENAVLADTNNNEFKSTIRLDPEDDNYPEDFIAESTVVLLDLSHYNRGDLEIELVSPSGTSSILNPGKRPESTQLEGDERWKLMTLKNWGEDPTGKWKLYVRDLVDRDQPNPDNNVFRDWKLIVYGRKASDNEFVVPPPPTDDSEDLEVVLPTEVPSQVPTLIEEQKEIANKICISDFNAACVEKSNGNTLCPANTIFVLGSGNEDELTMDADYVCPTDKLEGDDTKAAVDKASQEGLCTCKAKLFDWDCSLIEEDMECDCVACPTGSNLGIAYTCKKPIVSDCLAFNCDGECIQFVGDPEPVEPESEDFSDVKSKDVRPIDESEQSQWCLDPFSVNNSCEEKSNGQTKCPGRTVMIFDNSESERYDDQYTVDADIYCPTDLLEEEEIEFGEATRRGLCTCEAGLYNLHCDQIEEDLECECFECPSGSVLRVGYQCNKEIANGCTSFNCDGSCTDFFKFPTATPSEGPTGVTQKPTNPPTRNPTPGPTRKPTTSPTQFPTFKANKFIRTTQAPSSFPSSDPSESPSAIPTDQPTEVSSEGPSISFEPTEPPTVSPAPTVGQTSLADEFEGSSGNGNKNLSCEKAELMTLDDVTMEGTIRNKLVKEEGHCLSGLETVGGWYEVTGNGDVITVTVCSLSDSKSVGVSVFTGDCSEPVCLEHRSKQIVNCEFGNGHALSFASEQDKIYKVLVSGLPVGAPLQSSIAVSSTTAAELRRNLQKNLIPDFQVWGTTSKPPENSKCGAPETANFAEPIFGDTLGLLPTYQTCYDSQKSGAWYEVNGGTPIEDTGIIVYEANTCNPTTNFYQSMSVFRGESCGSMSCVDVDVLPCPSGFFGEQVYWSTSKQENFKIFVHSSDAEEADIYNAGEFKINLNAADRLANDQCSAAEEIATNRDGARISTTAGAKPDMNAIENSSCEHGGAGAWYTIVGDGETYQASTCSIENVETDHKTEIHVYSGECEKLNCIDVGGANKATCNDGNGAIVNFRTQVGVVYYILVTGRKEGVNGNFVLEVNQILPPNNNGCKGAKALAKGTPVDGDTLRATVDFPTGNDCVIPLDTPGVWYELEGKGKGVKVSTCQNNDFDSAISIFAGTCDKLTCVTGSIAANSDCPEGQGTEVSFYGEKDTTYLVYIHGKSESNNNMGDFTVTYDQFNMLESNEFCSDATVVPTDGTRVQGSTQDATQSSIPDTSCGVPITNPGLWYTFRGNGQPHQIEACSEDKGDFDVSVSVYEGGPNGGDCDALTCITGINFFDDVCSKSQLGRRVLQVGSASNFRFMTDNLQNYYIFVHGSEGVGDFSMWVRDENIAGFGTAAPTETPLVYGKDLYRWVPIDTEGLEIATDYTDLEFISEPDGLASIDGYIVNYTTPVNFTGSDTWTMDGCFNGECFRFDVTVDVMGDGYGDAIPETKGASKLWLLLLLLLLCLIPLCCLPFYLWNKKKKEEQREIDDDYSDRSGSESDDENSDDSQYQKGLLPNRDNSMRSRNDSSVDDWGSSAGSDDDASRDSRDEEGSDYSGSGSESESTNDGFNEGFDDEYKSSPRRR